MNEMTGTLVDRAWGRLRRVWRDVARRDDGLSEPDPDLGEAHLEDLARRIDDCLDGRGGEVSARAHAAEVGQAYLALNDRGRARFLHLLATRYGPDRSVMREAAAAVAAAKGEAEVATAEAKLRRALEAPRVRLLTQFNALPEGVKFLVDLRAQLLRELPGDPALAPLEADLKQLLVSWFDIGFLELRRITWRDSAYLLERLIAYEAVHEIHSWQDLKNRLDSDRRCFAFFHPRMPDEPLIFIEVALVSGMAGNIHDLLDESAPLHDPSAADTAIFYSISNAQKGLVGVNFGGFLIKRVVGELVREMPRVRSFATLSPIPGFHHWLDGKLAEGEEKVLTPVELRAFQAAISSPTTVQATLASPAWVDDAAVCAALEAPLRRLCAVYLTQEKNGKRARDRVANFHLTNGARVERINWLANRSPASVKRACGMMVNYLYDQNSLEANHEAYRGEGKIAMSPATRALAKG